ncbi:TPA: CRISPR-associated endonuclease Cas1 [Streptococcus suis]|nr:CRISPR-associated endonuclease Cas1 [Streptococcus suis]
MSDLYIQKSDFRLSLFQEKVIVRDSDSCIVKEVGLSKLSNVLIFGDSQLSTQLVKRLMKEGIGLYYFSRVGKFLGGFDCFRQDDFEKQREQLLACQNMDFCLDLAKMVISKKMSLQVDLLRAYDRFELLMEEDYQRLEEQLHSVGMARSIQELMGFEGRMAKSYFYYLGLLVPREFKFHGRSKRPAKDYFNALLNYGYSILYSNFCGYIRKSGLNPGYGFMHRCRGHHAALASDLMEPWRVLMVDDTVMKLVLEGELRAEHFEVDDKRGFILSTEGQRIYLTALRKRFLEIHEYVELDKKRYTFPYMVEKQLLSLLDCFRQGDAQLFLNIAGEAEDDTLL